MTEPAITPELVAKHNLTPDEYAHAKQILGREPSYTELGIFSVMWSEHCSYKNTRPLLKTFPTKSKKILVGAGEENAGIIDIGDGLAIAFKIESHNHPSAVEPFQGAATGVGGIVRDIFTMGARPICSVNSLRFGPITEDRPPHPGPPPLRAKREKQPATTGKPARISQRLPLAISLSPGERAGVRASHLTPKALTPKSRMANRKSQITSGCLQASWPASRITAIVSAFRPSRARFILTNPTKAIRS